MCVLSYPLTFPVFPFPTAEAVENAVQQRIYVIMCPDSGGFHGSQEADNHNTPEKTENYAHTPGINIIFLPQDDSLRLYED